jgi:hypothetical protein
MNTQDGITQIPQGVLGMSFKYPVQKKDASFPCAPPILPDFVDGWTSMEFDEPP